MKIKETYKTKEKIMNNSLTEEQVKVLNMSQSVINEVRKVIIGKDEIIIKVLLSILAGGHILIEDIPGVGKSVARTLKKSKDSIKQLFIPGMLFENMGITYYGLVNGHDIYELIHAINRAKQQEQIEAEQKRAARRKHNREAR